MFTPLFTPTVEHSTVQKNGGAYREFHPQGSFSPLAVKFASRGEVKKGAGLAQRKGDEK
jgi:hypothetical protein